MLIEKITYDHTLTEYTLINVRKIVRIFNDEEPDVEIAKTYVRHVVDPYNIVHLDQEDIVTQYMVAMVIEHNL